MIVYGRNVAQELIKVNKKIEVAYVSKTFDDNEILKYLNEKSITVKTVEKRELDRMTEGLHQGIVMKIKDYEYCDIDELNVENSLIVMLDHIEDPHNMGAIIRTCEAAGITGVVIPKDRSVEVNSTVVKTSAGTVDRVKIAMVTNLNTTIDYLKKQGFWIVGTDMEGENYADIDYKGKMVIVIGNEGAGISRLVKDNCDFIASIPMKGKINSLNASVAAGIIIFEAIKGR